MELDYLKGHMGNNGIVFLYGEQIPKGRELEAAVEVLQPHRVSGRETGILYPPVQRGDLMVKIVGFTSRAFITVAKRRYQRRNRAPNPGKEVVVGWHRRDSCHTVGRG